MNPPYRVLAKYGRKKQTYWFHWREPIGHFLSDDGPLDQFHWYDAADLKPVDHPKNDPEALKIIEQAQSTRKTASVKPTLKTH